MQDLKFALDIGTRGVTGLLYRVQNDEYVIHYAESEEHQDRAMQDGQIHDIQAVAKVITRIKDKLAEQSHQELREVAVAAAGRALRTINAEAAFPLDGHTCSEEDLFNLQLLAVQNAKMLLGDDSLSPSSPFSLHCVGYSVHAFYLDGEMIGNLIGQRGQEAKVSLIATFLPRVVIDSLDSALRSAGLIMHGLTLEPIAALNALIPKTMRKLNIALVDIGAGTSDIAVTADGTVQAYGMVPIAGDEITEALSELYLLDFPVAEALKRNLLVTPKQNFADVLGIIKSITSKKILQQLKPAIDTLAQAIADEILRLNNKTPTAVMLIGGGAKTPFIEAILAQKLGLSQDRVRVRERESIAAVHGAEELLTGPEAVTPIGIAMAAASSAITPISVSVDGKSTRLFAFHPLTVGDALLEAGIDLGVLKTRPGPAIVVEINGEIKALTGTIGAQGRLLKNQSPTTLTDILNAGDEVEVIPAVKGQAASGTLADLLETREHIQVWINDQEVRVEPVIRVNGHTANRSKALKDRDQVTVAWPDLRQIVEDWRKAPAEEQIAFKVNEHNLNVSWQRYLVSADPDGQSVLALTMPVTANMKIYVIEEDELKVQDALRIANIEYQEVTPVQVLVNGSPEVFRTPTPLLKNKQVTDLTATISNEDVITYELPQKKANSAITISDIISRLGDTLKMHAHGKTRLIMRKNGQIADFTTELNHQDVVDVYWE